MITREWINKDFAIHTIDVNNGKIERTVDKEQFFQMIDFWKVILQEKYKATAGQTCLLWSAQTDSYYYSAIFAVLELGMTLTIDMPHAVGPEDLYREKINMHGKIDIAIVNDDDHNPAIAGFKLWDMISHYRICNSVVYISEFDTYQVQDPANYDTHRNKISVDPDTIAMQFPSSGTTGKAKTNRVNHKTLVGLSSRMMDIADCKHDGNSLHIRNLHHGLNVAHHFLPTFNGCANHYVCNYHPGRFDTLANAIYDYKITNVLLYIADVLTEWARLTPVLEHAITVGTLFQIPTEVSALAKTKNISKIQSYFGATNVGSPIFVKTVTPDTDIATYNHKNFGAPVDDFFNIELRDNLLWASIPSVEQDWRTTEDTFELVDNEYIFHGRGNIFRINEVWVRLHDLENDVVATLGDSATVVIDNDEQKIYLAVWDYVDESPFIDLFKTKYPSLKISTILKGLPREKFFSSRKMDRSAIRDYCRSQTIKF